MKKLLSLFQVEIGIPIPPELLISDQLVPLTEKSEKDALLWGTKIALEDKYIIQRQTGNFLKSCPAGYYLIGFWGHGVNSYAFYYSRVDSWRKILFRLPFGGVYMDKKLMAKQIQIFLKNYIEFEKNISPTVKNLIAVDSMWEGYYKVVFNNEKTIECKESLFNNPYFKDRFCFVL